MWPSIKKKSYILPPALGSYLRQKKHYVYASPCVSEAAVRSSAEEKAFVALLMENLRFLVTARRSQGPRVALNQGRGGEGRDPSELHWVLGASTVLWDGSLAGQEATCGEQHGGGVPLAGMSQDSCLCRGTEPDRHRKARAKQRILLAFLPGVSLGLPWLWASRHPHPRTAPFDNISAPKELKGLKRVEQGVRGYLTPTVTSALQG